MTFKTENEVLYEHLSQEQRERDEASGIIRRAELVRVDRSYQDLVGEDADALPQVLKVGQQIFYYSHDKVKELWFLNRVTLLDPAVGAGEFVVLRSAKIIDGAKWMSLHFGDVLQLDEPTAITLMKARLVRPVNPEAWKP